MEMSSFQEQVFFSTLRIVSTPPDKSSSTVGTGFICSVKINDQHVSYFLVSNRHVFQDPKNTVEIRFHAMQANTRFPALGQTVDGSATDFGDIYTTHPDPSVDLACMNITSPLVNSGVFFKSLFREMLCDFNEPDLYPGAEIWFVGYPDNRFDASHNLPILRRGYIASMPKVDYNGHKQFVIDAQVFPGSSGSPVFVAVGSEFKLVGVVTATMIKYGKLEAVPATSVPSLGVSQTLGLGIVLKSTLVRELLGVAASKVLTAIPQA